MTPRWNFLRPRRPVLRRVSHEQFLRQAAEADRAMAELEATLLAQGYRWEDGRLVLRDAEGNEIAEVTR